ncbi:HelD family protein [Serinibacter salmoneus]|uniref:HelD family protein n=1 Tax=Serinibacter salmoneus TaxID=556530 RepID=UPI001FEA5353|nr:UvrD-helicase domain-containing protein [Serinibacter salmoneus]
MSAIYSRLDELTEQAESSLREVRATRASGTHQARSERDSFATMYADRLATYRAVQDRLVFGRLDLRTDSSPRYVGRIGVSDVDHSPILTDWRAPAARPFYQATAARPGDVVRRRHLATRGRSVVGVEDDLLDADALDDDARAQLAGEGALLASLNAHRTGRMHDIVATIQSEQDEAIRADAEGILVVQGGPGTGKTAVALHRAAYLLYAKRERLARSGVLLIGPSRTFLRYIERVLPALGETGVVSTTMSALLPGIRATALEDDAVAQVKGRLEMADVVARAVRARQRVPQTETTVRIGSVDLVIRPEDILSARTRARRSHQVHNEARVVFVRTMLSTLTTQYERAVGSELTAPERAEVSEEIRADREVRIALNLAWMPLSAKRLIADLWARPDRLAQAAPGMSQADRDLLYRERSAPWTEADVPLLDEAAELIGEDIDPQAQQRADRQAADRAAELAYARDTLSQTLAGSDASAMVSAETLAERMGEEGAWMTTAERAAADRSWTYGHVVVDEAQELSPMAWRALVRRCPSHSFTVVGDTGQTSSAAGASTWGEVFDRIGTWRLAELTINYRTPRSVMDAAGVVLEAMAPRRAAARAAVTSARDVAGALRITAGTLEEEIAAAATRGGTCAVIAPSDQLQALRARLAVPAHADLTDALLVLDPRGSKGLEFDSVVAIDVATMSPGDAYVTMTRPTRSLSLLGAVPEALRTAVP